MNIILQHFDGELRELDKLSVENIKKYAERINVDYRLVTGKPFSKNLTNPCQKVHCISHEWDDYDEVLMLDPDMTVKDINALYLYANEMGVKSLYYAFSMSAAQSLTRKRVMSADCAACEA